LPQNQLLFLLLLLLLFYLLQQPVPVLWYPRKRQGSHESKQVAELEDKKRLLQVQLDSALQRVTDGIATVEIQE
jgi:hypothetical protein